MFIVDIAYRASLERIDAAMAEHQAFLDRNFANGVFLMSGRKSPRTGGVIVAARVSLAELERILEEDPFRRQNLADYAITHFTPSRVAGGLEQLREN